MESKDINIHKGFFLNIKGNLKKSLSFAMLCQCSHIQFKFIEGSYNELHLS